MIHVLRPSEDVYKILPCTGQPRPISLVLDKGTIKHDTTQLVDVRTPCLNKGVLFENFFLGNPNVLDNGGYALTNLLIDTVTDALDWKKSKLRERLTGVCIDGQYINLNIMDHLYDLLTLPKNLAIDYTIWDPAHRMELACKYAKEGTKVGEQMVCETKWLH